MNGAKASGPIPPEFAGGFPAEELIAQAGGTPAYVYDFGIVRGRIARLRAALPAGVHVHYAIKANPYATLLSAIAPLVDGMDVAAMEEASQQAVDYVRSGRPYFLEARTYRFRAHSMYDAELYRTKEEVEQWKKRDPILLWQSRLREQGLLSDDGLAVIEADVAAKVQAAVDFAEKGEWEPVEDLEKDVYTE